MTRAKKEILEIMQIFERENPNPQCELNFHNPYTLLVAVMLSAQSTDKGVNKATEALFKIADSPQKMLDLGEEKLKRKLEEFINVKDAFESGNDFEELAEVED